MYSSYDSRSALPLIYGSLSCLLAAFLVFSDIAQSGILSIISAGFYYVAIFFHEIGHSLFGWVFGYVAAPSFDFQHGGGMSWHLDRSWPLQIIMWLIGAYGLFKLWALDYKPLFLSAAALYLALIGVSLTDFHEAVPLFMGHGLEAIIGGFLLARGFLNILLTRPEERWLNVFVGAYMIFNLLHFCWQINHDPAFQALYTAQKGSHGFGDLDRISNFGQHWTRSGVADFLMAYTIVMSVGIPALFARLFPAYSSRCVRSMRS